MSTLTAEDLPRIKTLQDAVIYAMSGGDWLTLSEIRQRCGRGSEAGISARIRELKHHGIEYDRRRRTGGLWEYRARVYPAQMELEV